MRLSLSCTISLHILNKLVSQVTHEHRGEGGLAELVESAGEELTLDHVHHLVGQLSLETACGERCIGTRLILTSDPAAKQIIELHLD